MYIMWRTACLTIAALATLLAWPVHSQHHAKSLFIVNDAFDFGRAPQNATLTQFFWFKAVGEDTVQIRQIKTGCACTTMPLERQWIAPGDSIRVGVFWDTERRVGLDGKYPYIYIVGQEEAERIYLTADITMFPDSAGPVSVKPFRAEFSKMNSMSIDSTRVILTNRSTVPVGLKIVSSVAPEYQVTIVDSIQAQSKGEILIAVAPEFKNTEFVRSLTIEYAGAQDVKGRVTIPIRRKIIS